METDAQGAKPKDAKAQATLEVRRKRNRDSMRRARTRQRAEKDRMQLMIDQLERQLHQLIRQRRSEPDATLETPTTSYRFSQYNELLDEGEQLRKENLRLATSVHRHDTFQRKLAREAEDELESHRAFKRAHPLATGSASTSSADDDDDLQPLPEWLTPVEKQQQLIAYARDMFQANAERTDMLIERANDVLGWRDKRGVQDGTWAQFVQTKNFPNERAEVLLHKSWVASTNVHKMGQLLKWATGLKVLHRLGDSAVIVARVLELPNSTDPDHPILYRYSLLITKAPVENGFIISTQTINLEGSTSIEQSLSQKLLRQSGLPLITMYGFTFTHLEAGGCRVQLSGRTSDGSLSYAHKVLIESLPAVLRWENSCVAPILRIVS